MPENPDSFGGPDPVYCTNPDCPAHGQACANPSGIPIDGSDGWPPMTCGTCDQPVSADAPT